MGILIILASFFHSIAPVPGFCAQTKNTSADSSFHLKFVGEGGGSNPHAPADAADEWETAARQDGAMNTGSGSSGAMDHPYAPLPLHPALRRPRPVAVRPRTDAVGPEPSVPTDADRRRYSLWDGLAAPMELSAQKIDGVSGDQAAVLGRKDYESHILGQRDAGATPSESRAPGAVLAGSGNSRAFVSDAVGAPQANAVSGPWYGGAAGSAAAPVSEVFVALNLDLRKHPDATLKDAIADLSRIAGFRPDPRFEPAAVGAGPDQVALWGWMPSSRVGAALQVPTVARLEVNPAARRVASETATDMLVGVRVPPGRSLAEAAALLERDPSVSGLRVRRTIGTQTAPGTAETVLVVEVSVPISLLPRLMALHDVVKMMPAPQQAEPQRPQRRPAEELRGFLAFVAGHSPMLLVLTLLMLLPWVGSRVAAVARVFVPYR